jgi:hypothetical protein
VGEVPSPTAGRVISEKGEGTPPTTASASVAIARNRSDGAIQLGCHGRLCRQRVTAWEAPPFGAYLPAPLRASLKRQTGLETRHNPWAAAAAPSAAPATTSIATCCFVATVE